MDRPITDINEARRILGSLMAGYEPAGEGREGYYINKKKKSMIYPRKKQKSTLEQLNDLMPKTAKNVKKKI